MGLGHTSIPRRFLIGTACLAFFLATPFCAQFLINLKPVKTVLSQKIVQYTGISVNQDNIQFLLFPRPGIRVKTIDISIGATWPAIHVDQADILINLSQIFQKKLWPTQVNIVGPSFIVNHGQTPAASLAPFSLSSNQQTGSWAALSDQILTYIPNSPNDININVRQHRTRYFTQFTFHLKIKSGKQGLTAKAAMENFLIEPRQIASMDNRLAALIQQVKADSIGLDMELSASGSLSARLRLSQPDIRVTDLKPSISSPRDVLLDVSLSRRQVQAQLLPVSLAFPKGQAGASFSYDLVSGNSELMFTGRQIDIAQAKTASLLFIKESRTADTLFDILRAGVTEDIMVGFRGSCLDDLFDASHLTITGGVRSGRVKIPEVPLVAEQVTGRAKMDNGILHIKARTGHVKGASISSGTLDIDLLDQTDTLFSGSFDLQADLSNLPETLTQLMPGTSLSRELGRLSQIKGTADARLELNMPHGEHHPRVKVTATKINVSGRYAPVPLPISVSQGEFHLDENKVILNNIQGDIGPNPVHLSYADVILTPPYLMNIKGAKISLSAQSLVPWATAHPKVMAAIWPVENIGGTLNVEGVTVSGPMFEPINWSTSFKGAAHGLSLKMANPENNGLSQSGDMQTVPQDMLKKEPSITGLSLDFEKTDDVFYADNISGNIMDLSWIRGDRYAALGDILMPVQLENGRFIEQKNKCSVSSRFSTPSHTLVYIDLAGKNIHDLSVESLQIRDGIQSDAKIDFHSSLPSPETRIKGCLNTRTLEKILVQPSDLYNRLISYTSGRPIKLCAQTAGQITINTPWLDLDRLLSVMRNQTASPLNIKGQYPGMAKRGLRVQADTLVFNNKTYTAVDAEVDFPPDSHAQKTHIQVHHAQLCGLWVQGELDLTQENDKSIITDQFKARSLDQKEVSKFFGCLLGSKSMIDGQYTFTGNVLGHADARAIMNHQSGALVFNAQNGRIYKATLLSRVLSVLNVLGKINIRQKGFGYKTIHVTADVKDSVIHLKKAFIDANDMFIIADGWVDPLNDKLDLTILVAPFKTIDTIIQHIPVINTVLAGRLVSLPAKASGKLSDPTVLPLHPSAVGKGLVNLLSDLANAPARLLKGTDNNE